MKTRPPRATISDVAHAARTGKTSVSRYLNGELHLLSADLKARIEQAIADLSYRPSQMARGLKRGRTRLIGLIIADITNPYSVDVMSGIEAACREQGFTLLMCNTNNEVDLEQHYLQLLSSYQVEGIVVNAVGMREEVLSHLKQSLLPMVLIDRKIPDFPCDVVGLNNAEAAETATRHLVDNGYYALLFLSEPLGSVNTRRERLQAFRQVMTAYPQVQHENAELTLQVARSLQRINLHWGSDIGLIGFDELEWAALAGVGITTLKQPTWQIGCSALQRVIARIEGSDLPIAEQVFSGELIVRGSSQPLR
ncbi:LacI family DNA-binding transcriptional regulator [Pantoea sp. Eser]|nr:LacI family DNA-binding transcriptional regulator [Pantoea sp. Eser]